MPKITVVTGCSSGLGMALCLDLANRKEADGKPAFKVFATARRLEPLAALKDKGIETLLLDVTDRDSTEKAFQQIVSTTGRIDILICNAGIAATAPLAEQKVEDIERIFQTNAFGVLRAVQAAVPTMAAQGSGHIVAVGSITAFLASPFNGAYSGSKAALHSFCETLSMELQPFGINVTEVWAGTMKTDINAKVAADLDRYQQPGSLYLLIAPEIRQRAALLDDPHTMSAERVAADIVKGMLRRNAPRYITTGSQVRLLTLLGYLQAWLFPEGISRTFQEKFGLKKLQRVLTKQKGS